MQTKVVLSLWLLLAVVSGCAGRPAPLREGEADVGYASWYGDRFHGRKTASGERYDMYQLTAAHRTAPFGTKLRVVNLETGKSAVVRVNDRGPFVKGRIVDLSLAAAREIGLVESGVARVRVESLGATAPPTPIRFFVQAGSFQNPGNARQMSDSLQERFQGLPVRVESAESRHRVWLGPFDSEAEAIRRVEELAQEGLPAFILRP